MKKIIIIFIALSLVSCVSLKRIERLERSIPSISTGTGPNTGTGESLYSAFTKLRQLVDEWNAHGYSDVLASASDLNVLYNIDHTLKPIGDITTIPTIYSAASDTSGYPVPGKIGNIYLNTSAGKVYISVSAARGGWRILN